MSERDAARRRSGRPRGEGDPLGIKAVDQALALLRTIAGRPGPHSLMQLARSSGMAPSKLHRYLVSLCRAELVTKADAGLYDLGPGALELGSLALGRLDDLACVEALVGEMVARLREIAFIYVWTQSGPVMIRSRTADHAPVTLRIGTIAPLIGTASGPVFVAHLPREVTEPIIIRDAMVAGVEVAVAERILFEDQAPRIRAEGVHVSDVTLIPNNMACAGPVFDAQGDLLFVIGTSMRRVGARNTVEEVAAEVRQVCAEISRRVGYVAKT